MPIRIVPPFDFVPRIAEAVNGDPEKLSLKRLREVVAGRDTIFPRSHGMAILQTTDFPNKHRDFQAVLENEQESSEVRYLAAVNLGKINTPAAVEILIENSLIRDERVLVGVMKALGRIGNRSALEAISTVGKTAAGFLAMQAEFAATLIAHREGLDEYEGSIPETRTPLALDPRCARPIRITQADDADAEFCLRSLADQPFGIEFLEHPMVQAHCGRNTWMVLLNRDFGHKNSFKTLEKRKAFLGIVASRSQETGLYSVAYLILTSPVKDDNTVRIQIYRTNGKLTFTGTAQVVDNAAEFSILALPQPGAFAVKIEGTFGDGRLDIKIALSTTFVQIKKREPTEELGAQVDQKVETEQFP